MKFAFGQFISLMYQSFLAINIILLESLFISPLNGATFVRKMHLCVNKQSWVYWQHPWKACQGLSANANQLFVEVLWGCEAATP